MSQQNKQPKPEGQAEETYHDPYQDLFNHMSATHGMTLLISEMDDIVDAASGFYQSTIAEKDRQIQELKDELAYQKDLNRQLNDDMPF